VSLGPDGTEAEIAGFLAALQATVQGLRQLASVPA
jgi:hypothetical protein